MKLIFTFLAVLMGITTPFQWQISKVGEDNWIPAPVPGTVAVAYRDAGLLEDISYDDNLTRIDDARYLSDFEYKTTFPTPDFKGRLLLNFDGINWKADITLNGNKIGRIEGAFIRGHFDITDQVNRQGDNELRVLIHKNDNPGDVKIPTLMQNVLNGGILGLDNPTFHASIGWDWIPTMPGRNIGIWNDVYLSEAPASVVIEDAFFDTTLSSFTPEPEYATVEPCITVFNYASEKVPGTFEISFGGISIVRSIDILPGRQDLSLESFHVDKPELWWPNKYGDPHLYDVTVKLLANGQETAQKSLKCGIREMKYTLESSALQIYINGRRFIPFGGNWGFSDLNLQFSAKQYDHALKMHRLMNFNMVRNWVGQVGDDEFFEACDKYGIMVWQDFCLANPSDGPNPADEGMFMKNAYDIVRRVRPHACIALWCARNEGTAPRKLELQINRLVATFCPRSLYVPNSSEYYVSGQGSYYAKPPIDYFSNKLSFEFPVGDNKFHSERGAPCIPSYESLCRTFRPEHRWPQNDVWAMHNFTLKGAQRCQTVNDMVAAGLGEPSDLKEFSDRAQYINYNTYRAMYESRSLNRNGLLIWMSHPAWPCLVFQTYDYWMDVNASVFAARKGCQALRIQWNPYLETIEVVNDCAGDISASVARVKIFDVDGRCVSDSTYPIDRVSDDSTVKVCDFKPSAPSDVYYVKLELTTDSKLVADNFYWEGRQSGNWQAIKPLKPSDIVCKMKKAGKEEDSFNYTVTVTNKSSLPAPMVRLSARDKAGEQVLPTFYEDNYFALLPGESRTLTVNSVQAVADILVESLR